MVYYNLKVMVMLKQDIQYEKTYQAISDYIAFAMLKDDTCKKLHEDNLYKLYNFCSLYPFEKEGTYIKGRIYSFDIKFVELEFAMKMKQLIMNTNNDNFKIVMSNIQTNEYRKITKLITLTPCILTTNKGDYKIDGNLDLVKERILSGIQKKYKQIYNESLNIDFINEIKQINRKPIKLPYKNIFFLGNKFEIYVKDDENSQKLAHLALSTGILEKNSQGYGFCKAR